MVARKHDIRRLYAKSIKVQDTSELERALKELEHEKQERKRAEMSVQDHKINFQLVNEQLSFCRKRIKELEEKNNGCSLSANALNSNYVCTSNSLYPADAVLSHTSVNVSYHLEKNIDVSNVEISFYFRGSVGSGLLKFFDH